MAVVESYNWGVTPITTIVKGERIHPSNLGTATGFFYCHGEQYFLVTNRHVAVNEDEGLFPNTFKILVHDSQTMQRNVREIELPLYDENLNPLWFEHPHVSEADIAVLQVDELEDGDVVWHWTKDDFPSQGEIIAYNSRVSIVGYPLGFYDNVHNFPITRSASVASPYGVAFRNMSYFLIDAVLHKGISGSPVIIPRAGSRRGRGIIHTLLGILSARETADLGVVWYPQLIEEIIIEENRGSIRDSNN